MKLKAAQLKKLSDSDFGLIDKNGKRSFPMPDKEHVLQAIRMFKYCPKGKEKELAANINKKAKEYKMKIHAKGAFVKYISPDVMSLSKEASNVGTLEPIVAGNEYQDIHIPALEDKMSDNDKIIALMANKKIKNTVHLTKEGFKQYTWEIDDEYKNYFNSVYENMNPTVFYPTTESVVKIFNTVESDMKLQDDIIYMTSSYTDDFSDRVNEAFSRENIEEIMKDKKIADISKCHIIASIMSNTLDNKRALYYLLVINKLDTSRTLIKKIVHNLLEDQFNQFDSVYGMNYIRPDYNFPKLDYEMKFMFDGDVQRAENIIYHNYLELNRIHDNIFNAYLATNQYYDLMETNVDSFYAMILGEIRFDADITGYYIFTYQNKIYVIGTFRNTDRKLYRMILMYKKTDLVLLAYDMKDVLSRYTEPNNMHMIEINCTKLLCEYVVDNTFFNGIYISPDGSVCLDVLNKLFINDYKDIETLLATNLDIKGTLCYIFSILVLIHNKFIFNKKWDKTSDTYLNIIKLKLYLDRKFKEGLRALRKNDNRFNFLEYYKNNNYMNKIHITDNNGLYNIDTVYSKLMAYYR